MATEGEDWLAQAEACERLGVTPKTLRRMAEGGQVRYRETPGMERSRKYSRSDLNRVASRAESVESLKAGDKVKWWYHPNHSQEGTIFEIPEEYGGRWAHVEYGFHSNLIETCRLNAVKDKIAPSRPLKVGGSESKAVMPTKPEWKDPS